MDDLRLVGCIYEVVWLPTIFSKLKVFVFFECSFTTMNHILGFQLSFFKCNFEVSFVVTFASFVNIMTAVNAFVFGVESILKEIRRQDRYYVGINPSVRSSSLPDTWNRLIYVVDLQIVINTVSYLLIVGFISLVVQVSRIWLAMSERLI